MKIQTFLALLLLVTAGCSCEKNDIGSKRASDLIGTWRLVGFGDEQGNVRKVLPNKKECGECYTITFDKDYTLQGHSSSNQMAGIYSFDLKNKLILKYQTLTEAGEASDGRLYVDLISHHITAFDTYKVSNNQLFLYYNTKNSDAETQPTSNKRFLLFEKKD